jgi:hypothetical protein
MPMNSARSARYLAACERPIEVVSETPRSLLSAAKRRNELLRIRHFILDAERAV